MRHAAELVCEAARQSAVTVVVSAMKGTTDRLLEIARLLQLGERQIARNEAQSVINLHLATLCELQLPEQEHDRVRKEIQFLGRDLLHEVRERPAVVVDAALHDRLASFGERLSARLFAAALGNAGIFAVPVASSDFVLTCDNFRDAKPQLERTCRRGRDILAAAAGIGRGARSDRFHRRHSGWAHHHDWGATVPISPPRSSRTSWMRKNW